MKLTRNTRQFRQLLKRLEVINNPRHHPHIKLAIYIYNISKQLDVYKTKTSKQINQLRKLIASKRHTKKRCYKRVSRRRMRN